MIEPRISYEDDSRIQYRLESEKFSMLQLFYEMPFFPKFYFKPKDSCFFLAAFGAVEYVSNDAIASLPKKKKKHLRYFGGARFDETATPSLEWREFGKQTFFWPALEIHEEEKKFVYFVNNLKSPGLSRPNGVASKPNEECNSSVPDYVATVELGRQQILNKNLKKVVIAHLEKITTEPKILSSFFENSRNHMDPASIFVLAIKPDIVFFGLSPEMLFTRRKRNLYTEALAGTRSSIEEEFGPKEIDEQNIVVSFLHESLNNLCEEAVQVSDRSCVRAGNLFHLRTKFCAPIRDGLSDIDLLQALHPTPALAGYPKIEAVQSIRMLENFDRGFFGGPIGYFSHEKTELAVAIRSALFHKGTLHSYAGAGITEASDPDLEWREVQNKLNFLRSVLGGKQA